MADEPFITPDDYPSVRRAISAALTADILPDDFIGDPVYLDRAVGEVLRLVPDAAARSGDELARVKRAMILMLAARLIPAIPTIKQEQFQDFSQTYFQQDPASRAADLIMQAREELSPLTEPPITTGAVVGMSLGKAPRVRGNLWVNPYDPY